MRSWGVLSFALVAIVACGSQNGGDIADGGAGSGSGDLDGAFASTSDGKKGDGGVEICNGIDDDGNGIIDDVDVGHDGICDCLKIATLGVPGKWGQGDVFASWLSSRSVAGAADLQYQTLTKELLAPYQVIVAQDLSKANRSYSPAEVQALNDWIAGGGGFMTLIGYADPSEVTNVNSLLAPQGISYGTEQILAKKGGSTIPITQWQPHPVTQGVTRVGVDNGYPVQGGGTVLATEQGYDVLRVKEVGRGHVLIWADEWITYDSEWSGHPDYQVQLFWLNAIKWLTPANQCQVAIPPNVK